MELLNQAMPTWAVVVVAIASYGLRWLQTRQPSPVTPTPSLPAPDVLVPNNAQQLTIGNGLLISLFANAFKAGLSMPQTPSPVPVVIPTQNDEMKVLIQKLLEKLNSPPAAAAA